LQTFASHHFVIPAKAGTQSDVAAGFPLSRE
jgi:hypothetical protein